MEKQERKTRRNATFERKSWNKYGSKGFSKKLVSKKERRLHRVLERQHDS